MIQFQKFEDEPRELKALTLAVNVLPIISLPNDKDLFAGKVAKSFPSTLHSIVPLKYGADSGKDIEEISILASPDPTIIFPSKARVITDPHLQLLY